MKELLLAAKKLYSSGFADKNKTTPGRHIN